MSHKRKPVQVVVTPTPDVVVSIGGSPGSVSNAETRFFAYHHQQGQASDSWLIQHGLGFYPNITVMDSGESTVEGELEHLSKYSLRVTFSAPISGNAYLS